MARKVFISVLGTGFYGQCKYVTPEFVSTKTRFIQQATIEKLSTTEEWTSEDNIIILLTSKAKIANWIVQDNKRTCRDCVEEYTGLRDELASMNLATPVTTVDIPDGKNEEEIWEIFDLLYNSLRDGDELYFDLTHGFRYIPMLVLVLGNYSKFLKSTVVKSITYGNYEARDPQTGDAPFVDITALSSLQDWTMAAADYLTHGDAQRLLKCADTQLKPVLILAKGKNPSATAIRKLCTELSAFCSSITFNRGCEIIKGERSEKIKRYLKDIDQKCMLKPLYPLFTHIHNSVEPFAYNDALNMLRASKLCYQYGKYQSAITLLQEGVVSFFCVKHNLDISDKNKRSLVNKAFEKFRLYHKNEQHKYIPAGNAADETVIDKIANDESISFEFVQDWTNISNVRNDYNHAGMRMIPLKVVSMQKNIEKCLDIVESMFFASENNTSGSLLSKKTPILVNLSNHPFECWSNEQQSASEVYGKCIDIDFPNILPYDDSDAIKKMATEYIGKIMDISDTHTVTVHIMGEMSFCHYVVSQLLDRGISCICSTTERHVEERENGEKIVYFKFERFRNYIN